jgi:hypothetical protein
MYIITYKCFLPLLNLNVLLKVGTNEKVGGEKVVNVVYSFWTVVMLSFAS